MVTEGFDDTRVRLPEPLHDLPVPELGFLLVAERLVFLALRVEGGLGDLRSNGQYLNRIGVSGGGGRRGWCEEWARRG